MRITFFRIAAACMIVSLILIIATVMIHKLNAAECSQMIIPNYVDTLRLMHEFKYRNPACRFTAQAIARYKIVSLRGLWNAPMLWNVSKLSDYALHSIVTGRLLEMPRHVDVFNHKNFVTTMNEYDASSQSFYTSATRDAAIEMLTQVAGKNSVNLKSFSDQQLYEALLTGTDMPWALAV